MIDQDTKEYREWQFEQVINNSYGETLHPKMKITSTNGQTHWFNITPQELLAIRNYLLTHNI